MVYAIVKSGGRQEKVAVGDKVVMDRLPNEIGETVELKAVLVGDGDKVTTDAKKLASTKVLAEVIDDEAKGPKISIVKYKNKSGYRKRQGHRQKLSVVKITEIA
ncbi:MAG: 50S ribosomal protein L21 [Scrofimicrobium sp.]